MNKIIQIFNSYAREDKDSVKILYQKLSSLGFKPWMDIKDLTPGEDWKSGIEKAIKRSDFFLVFLSQNSVNKGGFINKEIKIALNIRKSMLQRNPIYLIPVRLEDCDIPPEIQDFHWVDLFEDDGWDKLIHAIYKGLQQRELPIPDSVKTIAIGSDKPTQKVSDLMELKIIKEHEGSTTIQLKIKVEKQGSDETIKKLLQFWLVEALGTTQNAIAIKSVEKGSIVGEIEVDKKSAKKLINAIKNNDPILLDELRKHGILPDPQKNPMLCFKLHNDRNKNAWEKFRENDITYLPFNEFKSLLEIILEDGIAEGKIKEDYLSILQSIKKIMSHIWQEASIVFPLIAKKDITHNRRIIYDIERILFPKESPLKKDDKGISYCELIYEGLDYYDIFVLLCSAYLFDYAKGQHELLIPELPPEIREGFQQRQRNAKLTLHEYNIIEQYFSYSFYKFLQIFLDHEDDGPLKKALKEKYNLVIEPFIDIIPKFPNEELEELIDDTYDVNTDLAQKWLFSTLWKLRHTYRPNNPRPLLEDIQIISSAIRPHNIIQHDKKTTTEDLFDTIKTKYAQSPDLHRIQLLSALLRVTNNLDFTQERSGEKGALRETFKVWFREEVPPGNLPENYVKLFTKWIKFLLVEQVGIRHKIVSGKSDELEKTLVEIIIRYNNITNWKDYLLTIRNLVERDFMSTNYLKVLNRDEINLHLWYEIVSYEHAQFEQEKNSDRRFDIRIEGKLEEIFIAMRRIPHKLPEYQIISPEDTTPSSTLEFTPLFQDVKLPTNQNLIYLLGFLDNYGVTTCSEIAEKLGTTEFETLHKRRDFGENGNLIMVDKTTKHLSLNESRRSEVNQILATFREYPTLVRQKVRELEQLGFLLPFSRREADTVPSGIKGLDGTLSITQSNHDSATGFKHARNILIVGGPGSGKTTLLLQILHWNLYHEQRKVLMLTFEELVPVIIKTYHEHFGWNLNFIQGLSFSDEREKEKDRDIDKIFKEIHSRIEEEQPEIVAIDGLSRLRSLFPSQYRERIDTFFKALQIKGITGLFSSEETSALGPTEEYQADGIIHLYRLSDGRKLEIKKLRSQGFISGRHAFEIIDETYLESNCRLFSEPRKEYFPFQTGINVYPNEQYYASITNMLTSEENLTEPIYIRSGIQNLDPLLPGGHEGGYRQGNSILVLGSPGAGKTLFGLHFLKPEIEVISIKGNKEFGVIPCVLWLSFEGPKRSLERSIASFDKTVGYDKVLSSPNFIFKFIPPALISPEMVLYYISELVKKYKIKRIVIDSISEIDEAFDKKVRFRQYMTTLIHTLSRENVTSMFLYRLQGFFRSGRESGSDIATLVDTIISIRTFDMKNEIRRGLFVLKSRGRELRSKLQTMDIDPQYGIQLSYKGWELENLLSGETGSIHEPEIFLKLFYENPAEDEINLEIIKEFRRRYAQKGRFTEVRKPAIYSEFWSFRGNYGPGHANIRVVSISMYMVEAFRELDRLHDLDDFFPDKLKRRIEQDFRWKRYCTERGRHDNIPIYTDMGFLVARRDLASELSKALLYKKHKSVCKRLFTENGSSKEIKFQKEVSWQDLKELSVCLKPSLIAEDGNPYYVFSLPYLHNRTEFMAFFFEVLWSKGGDIYHFPIPGTQIDRKSRMAFYKEQILLNKKIWEEFVRIVEGGDHERIKVYEAPEIIERLKPFVDFFTRNEKNRKELYEKSKNDVTYLKTFARFIKNKISKLSIRDDDVMTMKNKFAKEALEFIYDLVFDSKGAIPNPYDGDFSNRSIFHRKWYSQIEDLWQEIAPKEPNEKGEQVVKGDRSELISIRPLPSFEIVYPSLHDGEKNNEKIYKSCTTESVWCLGIIKEALSPEIGWIFIDTLTSTEWVQKRAEKRRGFPHRFEELRSMEYSDPEVYGTLQEIIKNKQIKERIYHAKTKLIDPSLNDAEFKKYMSEFFEGEYHLRDVGDVLKYMKTKKNRKFDKRKKEFATEFKKNFNKKHDNVQSPKINNDKVSELSEFEEGLTLRSKIPANRPFFHHVESILHEELVKLLSPQGRRYWYRTLLRQSDIDISDDEIATELQRLREQEKKGKAEIGLIEAALQRMHDRLIFDLLTSVPGEIKKLWPVDSEDKS